MSYARWSTTDIYMFEHCSRGLLCMGCPLVAAGDPEKDNFVAGQDAERMRAHLEEHVAAGHRIGDALVRLDSEIAAGKWWR